MHSYVNPGDLASDMLLATSIRSCPIIHTDHTIDLRFSVCVIAEFLVRHIHAKKPSLMSGHSYWLLQ